MRPTITAIIALCATILPAKADDTWNHGGLYAGLVGGYSTTDLQAADLNLAGKGAFGGAAIGYGVVANGTYIGLELDATLRDIKPTLSDGSTTISFSNAWLASARARVGLPVGPALLYLTGGAAFAESKLAATDFGSDKQYVIGAVGGAGIEVITFKNLAVRVEALHYAMPAEKFTLDGAEASIKQSETVGRLGLTFKLN